MRVLYFGCWGGSGHYLFDARGGSPENETLPAELRRSRLDGAYAPVFALRPGSRYDREQPEGKARLAHVAGWTVLAFWDRSCDGRGASNSAFLLESRLDFAGALLLARATFPSIFQRFTFEVVPAFQETPDPTALTLIPTTELAALRAEVTGELRLIDRFKAIAETARAAKYPTASVLVEWYVGNVCVSMNAPEGNAESLLPDDPNEWSVESVVAAVDDCARMIAAKDAEDAKGGPDA